MLKPASGYIPGIDGLRAIAVLAVLVYHADYLSLLPGGFTGVDMFFVISGFVISQSLSERNSTGFADYLFGFYRRRLLRLLPALLVVVAVSFVLSAMLLPQVWLSEQNNRTGLAAFLGLSNFVLAFNTDTYFSPSVELNPYLHTWSLGVEEQFYLLFPGIWYLWLRHRQRIPALWALLPVLALASLATSAVQSAHDPLAAFYLLPSRFWELAAGALLYQLLRRRPLQARTGGTLTVLMLAGLGLLLAGFLRADAARFPMPWALATVTGTLLMITALVLPGTGSPPLLHVLLHTRVAGYLGRLSYSLYLWHWPVAVFIRWTVGFELLAVQLAYPLLVLGLAAASYHCIETPIRTGRSVLQRRSWVTATAAVAVLAVAMPGARWISENPDQLSLSRTADTYTWMAYRHAPPSSAQPINAPQLQGRQLFALGDSHTAAYRTMLRQVQVQLGVEVIEYEHGGCGVVRLIGADPPDCADRRETALRAIEAAAKPGDMVLLASLRMPELAGRDWSGDSAATWAAVFAELDRGHHDAAMNSAHAVLRRLQAAGLQVVIDAPKPLFKASANRCSDWFNRINPVCAPGLEVSRAQLLALRADQLQQLQQLQDHYPQLTVWDPFPLLCPGATCSAFDADGLPLYFDADHLSGHGNRVLAADFIQMLLRVWGVPLGADGRETQ
ncbi:acyltransferase family protein [Stenotrophomonas rhizophila]|uniref:acyltransferase family protein n=1 Tax=Stenotrophomonas rhizophila TaxID=216778 RepID=UPI001E57D3C1|nr:acyltransferase family protein [Stenotrophomonas rhizophila]MCC7633970.1 acyltransferase [Stenotrophomonas rhizophila]MCC7663304.1 acyltransferase [Stenotrophomonas rhizophila]